MKKTFNRLILEYFPISNQEAEWLNSSKEFREQVAKSKLYMIGQRKEIIMANFQLVDYELKLDLLFGSKVVESITIPLNQFDELENSSCFLELGKKIFRIKKNKEDNEPVYWATPDRLLIDHWRQHKIINGFKNFRELTKFYLYYVGISKKSDSISRLFSQAHKNRVKILTNERQINSTARLTDELYIFLFDIKPQITVVSGDDMPRFDGELETDKIKTISDAEKAFVKIMNSKYNSEKYENYPKSKDGLYDEGLERYGYVIDESISFETDTVTIWGQEDFFDEELRAADLILIEGDKVELLTHRYFK
jgi:hypothetical protein